MTGDMPADPFPDMPADPFLEAPGQPGRKLVWYRRGSFLVVAAVVVVAAITVITDLPVHASRASDISAERTVMSQTNQDLSSCAYAVHEAFEIWHDRQAGTLTSSDMSLSPSLLTQDQVACSYADDNIFELSDIEIPGSPAGRKLQDLVGVVTLWASSDAVLAIDNIEILVSDPSNSAALTSLATAERELTGDRAKAEADAAAADKVLDTTLPAPDLTVVPAPAASNA